MNSRFTLGRLDHSLSISTGDSQWSHNRNLKFIDLIFSNTLILMQICIALQFYKDVLEVGELAKLGTLSKSID